MSRKNKKRTVFYILGAVCAMAALLLALSAAVIDYKWQRKDRYAGDYSKRVLAELKEQLAQLETETSVAETETVRVEWDECEPHPPETEPESEPKETEMDLYSLIPAEMPYTVIDGIQYLGILSIPDLALELPVILLNEWDASYMDYAPCTYDGTLAGHDLIIMAHNYESHFRPILNMVSGQTVILRTADDYVYTYITTAVDVMHRSEREKLYLGKWDLTLFTCVPNTYNRCAVRCELVDIEKGGTSD